MNNSAPDQQKLKTKKMSPVLLLSGLFVAVSYIVLLIPFALYSIAQLSAMLGKRYGFLVMLIVFVALFVISLLLGSSLLFSAALSLFVSIPFFMAAIALREKAKSKILAVIVLLIPFIVVFCSFVYLPVLNNLQYNAAIVQVEHDITHKKQEVQKQVETNVSASPETQLITKYDEVLSQLQALENFKELRDFLSYNPGQRMVWFVFGFGSIFFFFALLISFANIIFLDLAFEQVEKIKAIIIYVLKNVANFSYDFVLALSQMPIVNKMGAKSSLSIVKHEANSLSLGHESGQNVKVIRLSLFKNTTPANRISLRGYSFLYEGKLKSWNFRQFSLPLPLVVGAIVCMAVVMFWSGGSDQLIALLAQNRFQIIIGFVCVISFAVLSILTLQGLFTFYIRVSNFVGLVFLLGLFVLGSSLSMGYYAILAIFGSIALLDYVYDWRKKKIN